jgi:hypothetical protein
VARVGGTCAALDLGDRQAALLNAAAGRSADGWPTVISPGCR